MSTQSHLVTRVGSIWNARGSAGFIRFLLSRLARTQSDMVFERDLLERIVTQPFGQGRQFVVIERTNLDDCELQDIVGQLLASESSAYRPGLEKNDIALAVIDEERHVLHRTFIQFETRYKTLLGESAAVPLLANCHTIPSMRGERLYPKTLHHAGALLAKRGYQHMIIACDRRNEASIRGIVHGGFQLKRALRSLVIFARFALQKIDIERTVRWRLVYF